MIELALLLLNVTLIGAALGCLLFAGVLAVELAIGSPKGDDGPHPSSGHSATYVVVIPAHDEVGTIERTLEAVKTQIGVGGRVLVVADNCRDETAAVSAALGAEVIERQEPALRGKGYALDFAMRHLAARPPEVIVVLDADCIPQDGTILALVSACSATGQPIQARYDMLPPAVAATARERLAAFAWRIKNYVRPLALLRLELPCLLMGTGMAFPWTAFSSAPLKTGHLVEDMVVGLELAATGHYPLFLPSARVVSRTPGSVEGRSSQRARWETGHIQVMTRLAPRFAALALRRGDAKLFAVCLHAAVPPLALFAISLFSMTGLSVAAAFATDVWVPALISASALVLTTGSLIYCWYAAGRDVLSASDVALVPAYALGKISLYARALAGHDLSWIRTKRD